MVWVLFKVQALIWHIWNEPNSVLFFPPQSSIVKMTELFIGLSFDIQGSPETTLFLSKEEQ